MPPTQQTPARLIERPNPHPIDTFPRGFGAIGGTTGKETRGAVLRRRFRYIARAAYFIAVHRSLKHFRWALAHEGTTW